MKKIILDLCGGTGSWSKPYAEAGYDVRVLTLPGTDIEKFQFEGGELLLNFNMKKFYHETRIPVADIHGILAAPPCTMFSMVRTTPKEPRSFSKGMKTVKACLEIIWGVSYRKNIQFWALENPRGYLRRFLGSPAFTFDPTEFGDKHNKRTDLWGNFNEPKKTSEKKKAKSIAMSNECFQEIPADYVPDPAMRKDAIQRSITPQGFAQAFFRANP